MGKPTDKIPCKLCEATIPDDRLSTLRKYNWGFVWASDAGMPSGLGQFYACQIHKDPDDLDEQDS
jgi:hypothetical protein